MQLAAGPVIERLAREEPENWNSTTEQLKSINFVNTPDEKVVALALAALRWASLEVPTVSVHAPQFWENVPESKEFLESFLTPKTMQSLARHLQLHGWKPPLLVMLE